MENDENKKSIREDVLATIKSGQVSMRPKWQFMLKAALFVVGGVLLFLVLLYVASFTIFILRRSGVWFVPTFGVHGWYVFLVSVPWLLVGAALIFIGILEVLVRHYAFAYRQPLLYSLIIILFLVGVGGFVVALTPLHRVLLHSAENDQLPVGGPMYRGFGMQRLPDVHRGEVIERVPPHSFTMDTVIGEHIIVDITPHTRLSPMADFEPGDFVVVLGVLNNGTVSAFGIQEIDREEY